MPNLAIRKLADMSVDRAKLFNPFTGEPMLFELETGNELAKQLEATLEGAEESPRPFIGIRIENEKPPKKATISQSLVKQGLREGWIELENPRRVHRSAGPEEDPWSNAHVFQHADAIVFKTVDDDVRYEVVEQPDKWPESKGDDDDGHGGDVRWFYKVKLSG